MNTNNPPWQYELSKDFAFPYLSGFANTDITIIGAGIAGCSTMYQLLENTDKKIILIEGNKIANGATGHNAGYVVADFEKSIKEMVKEFGQELSSEGIKEMETGFSILENMQNNITNFKINKFLSVGAYTNLDKFMDDITEQTLLDENFLHEHIYLRIDSPWVEQIPKNILNKIKILSRLEFDKKLAVTEDTNTEIYHGIITENAAVMNSALFCQNIIKYCLHKHADRVQIYENTRIETVHLTENLVVLDSKNASINCEQVVLCTNGFENFDIVDGDSKNINKKFHDSVHGVIGYMIGTLTDVKLQNNAGNFFPIDTSHEAYTYFSQRQSIIGKNNLICFGGPEVTLSERSVYRNDHIVDENFYKELADFQINYFDIKDTPSYHWHGLMGYTNTGIRIVGRDKDYGNLFYNLGCNGIGILPSIVGAVRLARIINGEKLAPSIFDPV